MTSSGQLTFSIPPGRTSYSGNFISPGVKRIIFWFVLGSHFILILCPLLWYLFINWLIPQPKELKVCLIAPPASTFLNEKVNHPSQEYSTPQNNFIVPDPGEIEPIPELPQPEPVLDLPKPEPTPKPDPKPKITETPKKVEAPKKVETPPKKSSILKPEDIIKSNKTVKAIKKKGQAVPLDKIIKSATDGIYSPPGGDGGPKGVVDKNMNDYYDKVSAYLYGRWQQPGKALLDGANPTVDVRIRIDSTGKVLSAMVVRKSGMLDMDTSVERLFAETAVLPAPPEGPTEFTITMMIVKYDGDFL